MDVDKTDHDDADSESSLTSISDRDQVEQATDVSSAIAAVVPVKRKRGRPRKDSVAASGAASVDASSTASAPRRKPGRPRKDEQEARRRSESVASNVEPVPTVAQEEEAKVVHIIPRPAPGKRRKLPPGFLDPTLLANLGHAPRPLLSDVPIGVQITSIAALPPRDKIQSPPKRQRTGENRTESDTTHSASPETYSDQTTPQSDESAGLPTVDIEQFAEIAKQRHHKSFFEHLPDLLEFYENQHMQAAATTPRRKARKTHLLALGIWTPKFTAGHDEYESDWDEQEEDDHDASGNDADISIFVEEPSSETGIDLDGEFEHDPDGDADGDLDDDETMAPFHLHQIGAARSLTCPEFVATGSPLETMTPAPRAISAPATSAPKHKRIRLLMGNPPPPPAASPVEAPPSPSISPELHAVLAEEVPRDLLPASQMNYSFDSSSKLIGSIPLHFGKKTTRSGRSFL